MRKIHHCCGGIATAAKFFHTPRYRLQTAYRLLNLVVIEAERDQARNAGESILNIESPHQRSAGPNAPMRRGYLHIKALVGYFTAQ